MKKSYKLENLGCANCAHKMECAIEKIEGVRSAKVNFILSKLKIEVEDADLSKVLEESQKAITKIERDCKIVI